MISNGRKKIIIGYSLSFFIPLFVFLGVLWIQHSTPFGQRSFLSLDAHDQYYSMLLELIHSFENGRMPMFLWNRGMGVDFIQNTFYYNFSIFNVIAIVAGEKNIENAMTVIILIKNACICVASYHFFLKTKHFYKNDKSEKYRYLLAFAAALAFSMSNFVLAYNINLMWMDCLIILPLLFLEIERIIDGKKSICFIFLLFIAIVSNFYFSVYVCLACALYFFLQNFNSIVHFFSRIIFCICSAVIAITLSSFVILPSIYGITNRAKFVSDSLLLNISPIGDVFSFLSSFNPFSSLDTSSDIYAYNGYCGSIIIPFLILLVLNKKLSLLYRLKYLACIVFMGLACNLSGLVYFLHGLSYPHGLGNRYAFILSFFLVLMVFENISMLNDISIGNALFCILLSGIYVITGMILAPQVSYLVLLVIITVYAILLLLLARKSIPYESAKYFLMYIWIAEIVINSIFVLKDKCVDCNIENEISYSLFRDEYNGLSLVNGERKTSFSSRSFMQASDTDWYSSVLNGNLLSTYIALGLSHYDSAEVTYRGTTPLTALLFNVKYILTNEMGLNGGYSPIPYVTDKQDMVLYKNDVSSSMGYVLPTSILRWQADNSVAENQSSLWRYMLGYSDLPDVLAKSSAQIIKESGICMETQYVDENHCEYIENVPISPLMNVTYQIVNEEDLYFYSKASGYRRVSAWIDDELCVNSLYTDTSSLVHVGKVHPGQRVKISIICETKEVGIRGTLDYELYSFDNAIFNDYLANIVDEPFIVECIKENALEGEVNASQDGILYISIPYSEGFSAFVDSEYVKPLKIGPGLMGIPVTNGTHTILLKYVTPGLVAGAVISLSSMLLLILMIALYKKGILSK